MKLLESCVACRMPFAALILASEAVAGRFKR